MRVNFAFLKRFVCHCNFFQNYFNFVNRSNNTLLVNETGVHGGNHQPSVEKLTKLENSDWCQKLLQHVDFSNH